MAMVVLARSFVSQLAGVGGSAIQPRPNGTSSWRGPGLTEHARFSAEGEAAEEEERMGHASRQ